MKILVLGGTQFVGRHMVEAMLAAGNEVTVFNRGLTEDALPSTVERLRGDRDGGEYGIRALNGQDWDACVDVSGYFPRPVRLTVDLLRDHVQRYVYVSAVRAYGDPAIGPVRESHPLTPQAGDDVTEINNATYGPLKAGCECVVASVFGTRATILRPQVVVGPCDPSGRFPYWLHRAAQGGEMLAPGSGSDYLQVIDARDLAHFTVKIIEDNLAGAFNVSGKRITWTEFMAILGAQDPIWVSTKILHEAGVLSTELPLFRPNGGPWSSLMDICNERAITAGLTLTDMAETIRATYQWLKTDAPPLMLTPEREAELIRQARSV